MSADELLIDELRVEVVSSTGQRRQRRKGEGGEGYAGEARPVDAVFYGRAVVVDRRRPKVFEVLGEAAQGVYQVYLEGHERGDGDGQRSQVEEVEH